LLAALNTFLTLVTTVLAEYPVGSCDENMLIEIQDITNDFIAVVTDASNEASAPCSWTNVCFLSQKYKITSCASGHDREIITFLVNPLPYGTVSAGVFKDCYQYEVTRVPSRVLNDINGCLPTTTSLTTIAPTTVTPTTTSACGVICNVAPADCCNLCFSAPPILEPNALKLIFPLTKELRCLVPSFGLPGAVLNYAISELSTKVRLVPRSSLCDIAFPALLTFDIKNCTACLEFRTDLECFADCCAGMGTAKRRESRDFRDLRDYHNGVNEIGYEQEFGVAGCKRNPCIKAITSCFEDLALARRIDVMGVHKCTEKVFFSFQVCIVPYKSFCLDICGCKIPTAISGGCCVKNAFRIQSDGEYSYSFIKKGEECEPNFCQTTSNTTTAPTTTPPTTTPPTTFTG